MAHTVETAKTSAPTHGIGSFPFRHEVFSLDAEGRDEYEAMFGTDKMMANLNRIRKVDCGNKARARKVDEKLGKVLKISDEEINKAIAEMLVDDRFGPERAAQHAKAGTWMAEVRKWVVTTRAEQANPPEDTNPTDEK